MKPKETIGLWYWAINIKLKLIFNYFKRFFTLYQVLLFFYGVLIDLFLKNKNSTKGTLPGITFYIQYLSRCFLFKANLKEERFLTLKSDVLFQVVKFKSYLSSFIVFFPRNLPHKFQENRLHWYDLKNYLYLAIRVCGSVLSR